MKPIFEYIDYRKFLSAYYRYKKETSGYFSYRYFSQKIGINSPSFLKHVIDGKRNLTPQMVDRFSKALDLSAREARYFRNLVLFNQAKTSGEKQEHYAVLRSMVGMVKESVLSVDQYDYFATWYTPVIRELICLRNFGDNYRLIAQTLQPQIQPSQAKSALELLLRLKLVERRDDGSYFQTSSAITADSAITSIAVRSFARTMVDHTKNALDAFDKRERHVSGITMGISNEAYDVIAAEIEAFKDRIKVIVNRDMGSSRIYQFNLSLFPVSDRVIPQNDNKEERSEKK